MQHFAAKKCLLYSGLLHQNNCSMVRYIMCFKVPDGCQELAQKIIDHYFDALHKNGPGGMRSQCYTNNENEDSYVHIKSFKKEAVANHHFKSASFRDYLDELATLCKSKLCFSRLQQQQTFESIY